MPNLPLLKSLFTARFDVFAIHWQKGAQSGYTPAYQYDPYLYRQHKMGGGTLQNFEAKTYLSLTDEQIIKHLRSKKGTAVSSIRKVWLHFRTNGIFLQK